MVTKIFTYWIIYRSIGYSFTKGDKPQALLLSWCLIFSCHLASLGLSLLNIPHAIQPHPTLKLTQLLPTQSHLLKIHIIHKTLQEEEVPKVFPFVVVVGFYSPT